MKMIIKYSGCYPGFRQHRLVIVVLLLFTSVIYADVTVNNLENDDKIAGNRLSLHDASSAPADSEQNTAGPGINNGSKQWALYAEQWELTRSGESLLSLPVLNQLINAWLLEKHKKIEVQYPGGEEGEFWVQELTDWLVSLGIPSRQMVIVPGSGADDMIKISLIK